MISIYSIKSGKLIRNVSGVEALAGEDMKGRGHTDCPDDFERRRWNAEVRAWLECGKAEAAYRERVTDDGYLADNGPDSINQARRRLAVEARLWTAFNRAHLSPMLTAEAEMRGVTVDALAAMIIEKDQQWIDREIARKRVKIGD
jgi:hypothetical protein